MVFHTDAYRSILLLTLLLGMYILFIYWATVYMLGRVTDFTTAARKNNIIEVINTYTHVYTRLVVLYYVGVLYA